MSRFGMRAARPTDTGFVVSRSLGELRRARVHPAIVQTEGITLVRALLSRPSTRTFVLHGGDSGVLVGAAVASDGGVLALALPEPFRAHAVRDLLLEAIGVGVHLPVVRWIVPIPCWVPRVLEPRYEPSPVCLEIAPHLARRAQRERRVA